MREAGQSVCLQLYNSFLNDSRKFNKIIGSHLIELFVPVLAGHEHDCDPKNVFNLQEQIYSQVKFESDHLSDADIKYFIVYGCSGSGKSSSAYNIVHHYWELIHCNCKNNFNLVGEPVLPIFVSFSSLSPLTEETNSDILNRIFKKFEFSKEEIEWVQNYKRILLILDDFTNDERLVQKGWLTCFAEMKNFKAIFFARPEVFVIPDARNDVFNTTTTKPNENSMSLELRGEEFFIQGFNDSQIFKYIENFSSHLRDTCIENQGPLFQMTKLSSVGTAWETVDSYQFKKWLGLIHHELSPLPQLQELGRIPFILTIILLILPRIAKDGDNMSEIRRVCTTEEHIYQLFVTEWYKFQREKVLENLKPSHVHPFLTSYFEVYSKNLAELILVKCGGVITEEYELTEEETLNPSLVQPVQNPDLMKIHLSQKFQTLLSSNIKILRDSALVFSYWTKASFPNNPEAALRFRFLHISFLEYFASRAIFGGLRAKFNFFVQNATGIRNDEIGITHKDLLRLECNVGLIENLVSKAKTDKEFSNLLLEIVKTSREISSIKQMAANAVTILNYAGYNFAHEDMRNVQIPGADLSHGILGHVDWRGANLEQVNLTKAWINGSKLQGANLKNIKLLETLLVHGADIDPNLPPYILSTQNSQLYTASTELLYSFDIGSGKIIQTYKSKYPYALQDCVINNTNQVFTCGVDGNSLVPSFYVHGWNKEGNKIPGLYFVTKDEKSELDKERCKNDREIKTIQVPERHSSEMLFLHTEHDILFVLMCSGIEKLFPCTKYKGQTCILQCSTEEYLNMDYCDTMTFLAVCRRKNVSIYNLQNLRHVITYIYFPGFPDHILAHPTKVIFRPQGDAIVVIGSNLSPSTNIFTFYSTNSNGNIELANMLTDFPNTIPPNSVVFHPNGNILASQHIDQSQRQLIVWSIDNYSEYSKFKITPLQNILDVDPWYYDLASALPYIFFIDGDGIEWLLYYKNIFKGQLNRVLLNDDGDQRGYDITIIRSRRKEAEIRKVMSCVVSMDNTLGACILLSQVDNENPIVETDLLYFSLPRVPGCFEFLIRHNVFYTRTGQSTNGGVDKIAFDSMNNDLYVADARRYIWVIADGQIKTYFDMAVSKIAPVRKAMFVGLMMMCSFRFVSFFIDVEDNCTHLEWIDFTVDTTGGVNFSKTNQICILDENESIPALCWKEPGDFVNSDDGKWISTVTDSPLDKIPKTKLRMWSTISPGKQLTHFLNLKESNQNGVVGIRFLKYETVILTLVVVTLNEAIILTLIDDVLTEIRRFSVCTSQFTGMLFEAKHNFNLGVTGSVSGLIVYDIQTGAQVLEVELWFKVGGILHTIKTNKLVIYVWSENADMCCVEINSDLKWSLTWSSKPSQITTASECNIGRSYSAPSGLTDMIHSLNGKGRSIDNIVPMKYIPFAELMDNYIQQETCNEKMIPVVRVQESRAGHVNYITDKSWVLSCIVKKKTKGRNIIPHMSLILEGLKNNRRFILKGHKQLVKCKQSLGIKTKDSHSHVVVSLEQMHDIVRFRKFAEKCKAQQWGITEEDGMKILYSIQDDQQNEELTFSLIQMNCVEWCISKLKLIGREVNDEKYFGLIVPSILLNS